MRKSALLASLAALGAAPTAFAGTLNVPSQYPTIQAAINAASTGDVVLVAVGTFKENIDLKGKAITIQGKDRKKTLIDGSNGGPCITMASGETAATAGEGDEPTTPGAGATLPPTPIGGVATAPTGGRVSSHSISGCQESVSSRTRYGFISWMP